MFGGGKAFALDERLFTYFAMVRVFFYFSTQTSASVLFYTGNE